MHDSAVASVRPALAQQVEHELGGRAARRGRRRTRSFAFDERRLERVGPRLGARLDEQVDVDLEVARADRHVHAVTVAAGRGERLGDRRLRDAEHPQHAPLRRLRARRERSQRRRLAARAARAPAARAAARAARRRRTSPRRARRPAPCRRGPPTPRRPAASPACGRRARSPCTGAAAARRRGARAPRSRPRAPRRRRARRPAACASSSIVRSSCVGPSPPETTSRSYVEPVAQRGLELGRVVADDRDARPGRCRGRSSDPPRDTGRCGRSGRRGRARSPTRRSLPLRGVPTGRRDDDHARLQPGHVHELAAHLDA